MAVERTPPETVTIAMTGAGGAGVVTAGQILLDAAAAAGLFGQMARAAGPQIRGGESAAYIRLGTRPVMSQDDTYEIHVAFDWANIERFAAELPLDGGSLVICDPAAGEVPQVIASSGARIVEMPLKKMAKEIPGGRPNMIGLGAVAAFIGLPLEAMTATLDKALGRKGREAIESGIACIRAGSAALEESGVSCSFKVPETALDGERWNISGNEATGLGALRGGLRFVAAYPITPATEILEWLAPNLEKLGGVLVQAEDELASINMIIGGSFGGVPSLTATSGPGLALMMESIGLAVASEVPVVIVNVMRGGPSTGIPTKSEQSDLNIALYGLHGDAPHLVTAANSVEDCLFTAHWSVHLAEVLQTPAIFLTDQSLGQTRTIFERPADLAFAGKREIAAAGVTDYCRYAVTDSGVSPMAIPGTPGGEYVADGLEHTPNGRPSSQSEDHLEQLDKRQRKLDNHDYGDHWADVSGDGEVAIVTWGSSTGPSREARDRARDQGLDARLVSMRLLAPAQVERFQAAIEGVERVLVVEQSHSRQFFRYLRAHYDLPAEVKVFNQPGPLPIRPGQVLEALVNWS